MQVLAGDMNSEMISPELNPAIQIQLQIDSVNNMKFGKDSIDIDLDSNYDLFILQNLFIEWNERDKLEYYTYYGKIVPKNGLEILAKSETYYIGLGQTRDIDWVDTLNYKSTINRSNYWSYSNKSIFMWVLPSQLTMSNGCWFDVVNCEKYIGIRMKINSEYKYGWVKLNQDSDRNIIIQGYAIEE